MNASELPTASNQRMPIQMEHLLAQNPGSFINTGLTSREIRRRAAPQRSRQFKRHGWVLD